MNRFPIEMIVVCSAHDYSIGSKNGLPFNLKLDMKRFRAITRGHGILMGSNTAKSIGRPLRHRRNYVLTHGKSPDGFIKVDSIKRAIELELRQKRPHLFIAGGESIYRQAMPLINGTHITVADVEVDEPDAYLPHDELSLLRERMSLMGKSANILIDSTLIDSGIETNYTYISYL